MTKLQQRAEQGDPKSQVELGEQYELKDNYEQALYWYMKAAEQGDAEGQSRVGDIYWGALGVPRDYEKAVYWYKKAAEQEHPEALYTLAAAYYYGQGVAKDNMRALYMCVHANVAADGGDPDAEELGLQIIHELMMEAEARKRTGK